MVRPRARLVQEVVVVEEEAAHRVEGIRLLLPPVESVRNHWEVLSHLVPLVLRHNGISRCAMPRARASMLIMDYFESFLSKL